MEWSPHLADMTPDRIAEAQSVGLKIGPWGVSTAEDIARATAMGAFSLTVSGAGVGPDMTKAEASSIDAYIAAQPEAARAVLQTVPGVIRRALPDAQETISYKIRPSASPAALPSSSPAGPRTIRSTRCCPGSPRVWRSAEALSVQQGHGRLSLVRAGSGSADRGPRPAARQGRGRPRRPGEGQAVGAGQAGDPGAGAVVAASNRGSAGGDVMRARSSMALDRRRMLQGAGGLGLLGLGGCASLAQTASAPSPLAPSRRCGPARTGCSTSPSACGRSGRRDPGWMWSRSAIRWWCTTTATAAPAGRCPGAPARWRCGRRWRPARSRSPCSAAARWADLGDPGAEGGRRGDHLRPRLAPRPARPAPRAAGRRTRASP